MKKEQKIELLNNVPSVSDAEVESFKNFDSVLKKHNQYQPNSKVFQLNGKLLGVSAAMAALITSFYFYSASITEEKITRADDQTEQIQESVIREKEDVLEKKQVSTTQIDEIPTIDDKEVQPEPTTTPKAKTDHSTKPTQVVKENTAEQTLVEPQTQEDPSPSKQMREEKKNVLLNAAPIKGYDSLYSYIQTNLVYPEEFRKDSIEGTTLVSFAILKDSTISNIKIKETLGPAFDLAAARVIENMPKWKPATVNGLPVASRFIIPIKFELKTKPTIDNQTNTK